MQACLAGYETGLFCIFDAKTLKLLVKYTKNGRQACLAANEIEIFCF
jgi:hypothetical protein